MSIAKSPELTITKKLHRSGRGVVLPIPKDVVDLLLLDQNSYVEATLRKVSQTPIVIGDVVKQ